MNPGIHSLQKHEPLVGVEGMAWAAQAWKAPFFFSFFDMSTQDELVTFMRHDLQPIELPFEDAYQLYSRYKSSSFVNNRILSLFLGSLKEMDNLF
jgi:hypothetical protein